MLGSMVVESRAKRLAAPAGHHPGRQGQPADLFTQKILGIDIDNETLGLDEVESVGGLLMVKLGDIPKQGQKIEFPRFDIVVKKMNGPRIVLVKVIPQPGRDQEDSDERD